MKRASILLTVGAFLLGLILQPVLGQLIDPQLRTADRIIIATSIVVACALLAAGNAFVLTHRHNGDHVDQLGQSIRKIESRLGLRVEFLERGESAGDADPYGIMLRLVSDAESEILILDHRPPRDVDRFGGGITLTDVTRQKYYELLSARTTQRLQSGRYLRYRRIVQLDSGASRAWDSSLNADVLFADHCKAIVDCRARDPQCPSAIKTSSVFLPNASIVIVDGRIVLLELAITGPDGAARVQGDLVFYDPDGVLTLPLRELFENIDGESELVTTVV
jgi:hypothetical protein